MTFNSPDKSRDSLVDYPQTHDSIVLNDHDIKRIEDTKLLGLHEKLILLQLSTHTRMAVETGYELIDKREKDQNGFYYVPQSALDEHEKFLDKLPYPYVKTEIFRKGRNPEKTFEREVLYMVCANTYIKEYISNYWQTFRDYEFGVIYGYPTSAILAYLNMLERHPFLGEGRNNYSTSMEYIGCGIYSKLFFEKEKQYYDQIWDAINRLSPKLIEEAENELLEERKADD